jgi:hypothetical protein
MILRDNAPFRGDRQKYPSSFYHLFYCIDSISVSWKKLAEKFTCDQILSTLKEMNFIKFEGKGYVPTYMKTELTNALHENFGLILQKKSFPLWKWEIFVLRQKSKNITGFIINLVSKTGL